MKKSLILGIMLSIVCFVMGQGVYLLTPTGTTYAPPHPTLTWQLYGMEQGSVVHTLRIAEYDSTVGSQSSLNQHQIFSKSITSNNPYQIYLYPSTAPTLSPCTEYVWQVTVSYIIYSNQEPIVPLSTFEYASPIAHFMISGCESDTFPSDSDTPPKQYIELSKQIDHFVYLVSDSLYIRYNEVYDNGQISYRIYHADDVLIHSSTPVHYGLNHFAINLAGIGVEPSSASTSNIYMLEIKTPKGDLLRTKFERQ